MFLPLLKKRKKHQPNEKPGAFPTKKHCSRGRRKAEKWGKNILAWPKTRGRREAEEREKFEPLVRSPYVILVTTKTKLPGTFEGGNATRGAPRANSR